MVASFTGLDTSKVLSELTDIEMNAVASAIQRIEGYIVGTETSFIEESK